ncbi:geranylgeranylglyceryl/heptaprenylglyceryl phosphate synthase [Winogradskyella aurantiaca]|uniref:geranylgeranylglyceryl/heptaprenylglyceryl phosphate synthase n=1 Tax=Winogradskyella aurantiaca TaxID=2219558 RepID=UPI000E1D3A64|nr:geranylgeranylglyceryl/heptaprenylglyceryl phosphate synthase [Winogradskyella aurantiaca]
MQEVYKNIVSEKENKLLAVLIDPENEHLWQIAPKIKKINSSAATHIFVGGSTDPDSRTDAVIKEIKKHTALPVVIFPGDTNQISASADALLFLSLISGRNPDYLIGKHVTAVPKIIEAGLDVIPTAYILIEGGSVSAVERVSKTKPLSINNIETIVKTAKAGELLGMNLVYLEAGSGASFPIPEEVIRAVKNNLNIPLIVGGGVKTKEQLEAAYEAGADMVVVGTAFEQNTSVFETQLNQKMIIK